MSDSEAASHPIAADQLKALEQQLDELVALTKTLGEENRALRAQQKSWSVERAKLLEKNELAKTQVTAMIARLKSLEQS